MALVQRCELLLVKPFDHREHCGVHEPEIRVLGSVAQPPDPAIVLGLEVCDLKGACHDVVEQGDEHPGMQARVDPVVDLDQDGSRDDQWLVSVLDERTTGSMVRIAPVQ
jgi:hypothetical protein